MANSNGPQIQPPSRLLAVRLSNGQSKPVPDSVLIADAEAALNALAETYPAILAEAAGAMASMIAAGERAGGGLDLDTLYRLAHDVRGQAASVGYPMATKVAQSLCGVIEACQGGPSGAAAPIPMARDTSKLGSRALRAHVDALAAIAQNRCSGDGGETGRKVVAALASLVEAERGSRNS